LETVVELARGRADTNSMNLAAAAVSLIPGLAFGSFLNVIAARVPLRRSIVRPASACMACGQPIAGRDNIPLVSYMLLRGRCRACGAGIPLIYPAVELATALLVAACVLRFGLSPRAAVAAFFCSVLVVVSATDLTHRIVPNRVVLPAAALVLVAQLLIEPRLEWPLASLGAALFLFAAALAYPKGMGMGDVKLALLLGAALGRGVAVALMLGMLAALVPAVVLLVRHGAAARKMALPFAPFLALGAVVALFVGEPLLDAYFSIF
jgi:leader peptidase (prepilin peptidase) / N-methyltransferase